MDFMTIFFEKMGIHDLRFKPAYNPYTEPSMEIFSFHPGLNKLVEIGNSGMYFSTLAVSDTGHAPRGSLSMALRFST